MAEGGEGRVFDLPDQPGLLYKEYRRPVDPAGLAALVGWAGASAAVSPDAHGSRIQRVRRASAWPTAVVVDRADPSAAAVGLLMPRAPRRFALRHRDGVTRLATLSYLTADPVRRAAAYGVDLPAHGDVERIGLVYALARLLEAFERAEPAIGHGDLSAKNVLWSTQRGPEVFVLDCDNSERFDAAGMPLGGAARRRAMTPNWDDPAVAPGANPTLGADRYSLGLIFLRVVGGAHFPLQKRQRAGGTVEVDLDIPPPALRSTSVGAGAPLWGMVSRSLSAASPASRPTASAWAAALHEVLVDLGAARVVDSVHVAQGSHEPSTPESPVVGAVAADVVVRPQPARARVTVRPSPAAGPGGERGAPSPPWSRPGAQRGVPSPPTGAPAPPPAPLLAQARAGLVVAFAAWRRLHRRAARSLTSRGRRGQGLRRLAVCAVVDFAVASFGLLLAAMVVSPFLGI